MQRLYRRNRRRAAREALKIPSLQCNVPADSLKEKFFKENDNLYDPSIFTTCSTEIEPPNTSLFTPIEIQSKLGKCKNTAPGPDRLTYQHLKKIDPDCKTIASIFNICLKARRIPQSWKDSTTIFIPKSGEPSDPGNWRPIALSNTLYKLFTSLIAKRLSNWIENNNNLLSPDQKGFRPFDGTMENNYMLEYRIRVAKKLKKEICILLVDIKNAFGSIPHKAIIDALRAIGAGELICDIVNDIYTNAKTCLLTSEGISEAIDVLCGVKQGCALSSILFIITIDPILRAIQRGRDGLHNLSYANDEAVIEDNEEDLNTSIEILVNTASKIGLSLNPKKCFTLHIRSDHQSCLATQFSINGEPVAILMNYDVIEKLM